MAANIMFLVTERRRYGFGKQAHKYVDGHMYLNTYTCACVYYISVLPRQTAPRKSTHISDV